MERERGHMKATEVLHAGVTGITMGLGVYEVISKDLILGAPIAIVGLYYAVKGFNRVRKESMEREYGK